MDEVRPLRLMQVMLGAADGGAENFFEKMAVAFQQHPAVEAQRVITAKNPRRVRELCDAGCDAHAVPASGLLGKLRMKSAVQKHADEFKPDVVMTYMNRASQAAPRLPNGIVMGRLGGYYNLKNFQRCDHLVGITPKIVAHLVGHGWPEEKTSMIPNFGEVAGAEEGVDLRETLGIQPDQKVLLSLGRLHQVKAHDLTIRALKQLPECVLLIAGEGPIRAELEALAQSEGVAGRVRLLGWRRDLANLFATSDICVFPSRHEPLGSVTMESWARSVPLVASKADGPAWVVEHEKTGLLFDIDDLEGLTSSVRRVLDDQRLREQLVSQGLARYHADFTRSAILDQYVALFRRLLDNKED